MSEQFSMGESHHKHPKNLSKNYQKVHESYKSTSKEKHPGTSGKEICKNYT